MNFWRQPKAFQAAKETAFWVQPKPPTCFAFALGRPHVACVGRCRAYRNGTPLFFLLLVFSFFRYAKCSCLFCALRQNPSQNPFFPALVKHTGFRLASLPLHFRAPSIRHVGQHVPPLLFDLFFIYAKAPPAAASCAWTPSPTHQSWGAFCRQPPGCLPVSVQCARSTSNANLHPSASPCPLLSTPLFPVSVHAPRFCPCCCPSLPLLLPLPSPLPLPLPLPLSLSMGRA